MEITGKYIYGIMNSAEEKFFGPCGITACENVYPVRNITDAKQDSKISNGVYTIPYQDISAVVSDSEIVDYAGMRKDALARLLLRHQKGIEKIMDSGDVIIPMKLGTFVKDKNEVKDILNKGCALIKEILEKINDKIEIDVACTWSDFTSALKETAEEKEIKEHKEKLLANPKGITVDEQMKVGFMVKRALDEKAKNFALQIQDVLRIVAEDVREHELMDDKMIINSAFLINKNKREDFYKRVEQLNAKFNERLNFRCIGPLPPYSFYTLEIKKMNFEDVDQARKRLQLSETATKEEIKRAHQAKAFYTHPDKNPNVPDAEKEFEEVNKAYKVLLDYYAACEQLDQKQSCSFSQEDFKKNTIFVKIKE